MIITSLLDTDLYKFTMMQVVLHQFPGAQVEYRFKCRNPGVQLAPYANEIRDEIRSLCSLHFQDAELAYLRSMRFIKSDFVDFLGLFRLNEKYITITPQHNGEIEITIRGPWLHTILFEIPVLAIVNEVYFRNTQKVPNFPEAAAGWTPRSPSCRPMACRSSRSPITARAGVSAAPGTRKCCACCARAWARATAGPARPWGPASSPAPAMCCMR